MAPLTYYYEWNSFTIKYLLTFTELKYSSACKYGVLVITCFSYFLKDNPASNLLSWDVSKKRWLCTKGEPSCSVVLQLTRAVKVNIHSLWTFLQEKKGRVTYVPIDLLTDDHQKEIRYDTFDVTKFCFCNPVSCVLNNAKRRNDQWLAH